jgi:hypothetical protein
MAFSRLLFYVAMGEAERWMSCWGTAGADPLLVTHLLNLSARPRLVDASGLSAPRKKV